MAIEPTKPTEPEIKLSEDLTIPVSTPVNPTATPSIRTFQKERFVEERELKLVENRWYIPGETKPYTGRVKRWSDEGWKQAEGSYKNGVQDGRWKTWWDNGLISTAVEMKNGRAQGEAKYWYDNGQMKEKGTWAGGKFTATAKWNKAGDPIPVE